MTGAALDAYRPCVWLGKLLVLLLCALIGALLERGYTLNNIRDLLSAWEQGRELNDILGLEVAVTSWQNPGVPSYLDYQDLLDDFGEDIIGDHYRLHHR